MRILMVLLVFKLKRRNKMKIKLTLATLFMLSGCATTSSVEKVQAGLASTNKRLSLTDYKLQVETCKLDTLTCLLLSEGDKGRIGACFAYNQTCVLAAQEKYKSETGEEAPSQDKEVK